MASFLSRSDSGDPATPYRFSDSEQTRYVVLGYRADAGTRS